MDEAPDLAEPIGAWRIWHLGDDGDGPCLLAPARGTLWPARAATTATCPRGCERPPTWDCSCGLYALAEAPSVFGHAGSGLVVLGCTALWGRVVEATEGWRAERGYPLVLLGRPTVPGRDSGWSPMATAAWRARLVGDDTTDAVPFPGPVDHDVLTRLGERYAVPVVTMPAGGPRIPWPTGFDGRAATALRDEAVRGLDGRRRGDRAAHDRLARAVETLLDGPGP